MRIFSNVKEMVGEVERELYEMGINSHPETMQDIEVKRDPNYATKELLGYSYGLTQWDDLKDIFSMFSKELQVNGLQYCRYEHKERIATSFYNPGVSYKQRYELWKKFLEFDGRLAYTYNERIRVQLERILQELESKQDSRQCIITIYDHHQDLSNIGGKRRVPCSLHYQLLQRIVDGQKRLTMVYAMRSCDFYSHFPVDVFLAIQLLEYIADEIGAVASNFIHQMGSLHAYKKDQKDKGIF